MTISATKLLEILFESPDAYDDCDGCDNSDVPLLELPNCDDGKMYCQECFKADDHRGKLWRKRIVEWWEESREK